MVQPELAKFDKFSLLYDGTEVGKSGITAIQVFFWNSGSLEILSSQVLKPYSISISDEQILSWSIIKTNRGVIQPQLVRTDENFNSLRLSFAVLEPGDGVVIEIVYDGPPSAKVEIDGICVGSHRPTVLPSDRRSFSTRPKQFLDAYTGFFAVTLMACTLIPMFYGVIWIGQKLFSERTFLIIILVFLACPVFLLIFNFIRDQYSRATRKYVPEDIKPD
ncbi:MAG TPA: hypothetical protein VKG86_05375 [Terracidiphilus sp.]|nr:hypothetical protein [Terracidiphilus sp.]